MAPKPDRIVVYRPAATKTQPNPGWRVQAEGPRTGSGADAVKAHHAYGRNGVPVVTHKTARKVLAVAEGEPMRLPDAMQLAADTWPGVPVYVPQTAYDPKVDEKGWDE